MNIKILYQFYIVDIFIIDSLPIIFRIIDTARDRSSQI